MESAMKIFGLYLLIYSAGVGLSVLVDSVDQTPSFILELLLFFGWGTFLLVALGYFMYKNDG